MRRLISLLVAVLPLMAVSCTHKELCYDHTHTREIKVVFDWNKAPDASPKSMSLYLFPEDGSAPLRYEFTDRNGGEIRVVAGRYKAICLNSDTKSISILDQHDYDRFCITTKDASSLSGLGMSQINVKALPKAEGAENERWVASPEHVWSGCLDDLFIEEHGQTITFEPEPHIKNCNVEIRNVENLRWINAMSASLSTMAGGYHPSQRQESAEQVTIPFETLYDVSAGTVKGSFTTFGHCPEEDAVHQLVIYVVLADDSKWYYTFDVTEQIHSAEDMFNIYIVLDELPIPKPVVNGGGFKPSVGEWNEMDIYIKM